MMKIFAQETPLGQIKGLGPFGETDFGSGGTLAMQKFTGAISAIIGFLTVVAAIWFFIQFILGGFSWITAGGDKTKLTQARDKLSNAFIGLVVVVAGWAIVALAGQFFGWTDILNPDVNKILFQ